MSDWIEQYAAALTERDAREHAHKSYIDAYTKLADRKAQLSTQPPPPAPPPATSSTPNETKSPTPNPNPDPDTSTLRANLSATQKARLALESELSTLTLTLDSLRTASQTTTTQLATQTRLKQDLERKLRDRDDELREKGRLVEQAHDEMVALGLEMNMAEQRAEGLRKENEELVARWMKRVGMEAERVNRDAGWE